MIFRALFFEHNAEVGRGKRRLRKTILHGSPKLVMKRDLQLIHHNGGQS